MNLPTVPYQRWEFSILSVAERIHGALSGAADPLSTAELDAYADWLEWRLHDGWYEVLPIPKYDAAVHALVTEAWHEAVGVLSTQRPKGV